MELVQAPTLHPSFEKLANRRNAKSIISSFLDTITTAFGRATHYNTREEQQAAELKAHSDMLRLNRDLYAALLTLPGVTDRAVQMGVRNLLTTSMNESKVMTPDLERNVLYDMFQNLPPQRTLKVVQSFKVGTEEIPRANNARTRKLILRVLLGSPSLEFWSVKYRKKMAEALTHAWGKRKASIIREFASKTPGRRSKKEHDILHREVVKYSEIEPEHAIECVAFILRGSRTWKLPLFKAYRAAKDDISKGKKLPLEVLEGIRSGYHPDVSSGDLLKLVDTKNLGKSQKLNLQRKAKETGATVEVNFNDYDAVRLYLYAFEMGMTDEIEKVLDKKAETLAKKMPLSYQTVGIVLDASESMLGDKTQRLRPMATALALRDVLMHGRDTHITFAGGQVNKTHERAIYPEGGTDLASALVRNLKGGEFPDGEHKTPDAVFILSDGYENASAGRVDEVIRRVRDLGIDTPIYHLNPVMAAESTGVRELAQGKVLTMPVSKPESLPTSLIRGLVETDLKAAIAHLLSMTKVPQLGSGG